MFLPTPISQEKNVIDPKSHDWTQTDGKIRSYATHSTAICSSPHPSIVF